MKKEEQQNFVIIDVKIQANAGANEISGRMADGVIKIKIKAPAVDNKANKQLVHFLSEKTGVPKNDIIIIAGLTSSRKKIKITGIKYICI